MASLLALSTQTMAETIKGTNYQSPYCGCCKEWVKHMKDNGFDLDIVYEENLTPVKIKLGLQPQLASCHTAEIEGYTFEGHIPASDIKRFLDKKPKRMIGLQYQECRWDLLVWSTAIRKMPMMLLLLIKMEKPWFGLVKTKSKC